jgi:hypothetical protein
MVEPLLAATALIFRRMVESLQNQHTACVSHKDTNSSQSGQFQQGKNSNAIPKKDCQSKNSKTKISSIRALGTNLQNSSSESQFGSLDLEFGEGEREIKEREISSSRGCAIDGVQRHGNRTRSKESNTEHTAREIEISVLLENKITNTSSRTEENNARRTPPIPK